MKTRFTTVSKWKKDPLGRNLLVNKTINGQPIYRSLSLEKLDQWMEENPNEIKKEILDKEQKLIAEELKNSGKSEDIAKKISLGKINKFKEENSLMTQQWVMEPKKKVKDIIQELGINDLKVVDFYRIKIGD